MPECHRRRCVFLTGFTFAALEETLSFCLNPTIIQPKNYFVLSETLNLLMTYFPGSECSGNCIEL
jgi:hypothetical protein